MLKDIPPWPTTPQPTLKDRRRMLVDPILTPKATKPPQAENTPMLRDIIQLLGERDPTLKDLTHLLLDPTPTLKDILQVQVETTPMLKDQVHWHQA